MPQRNEHHDSKSAIAIGATACLLRIHQSQPFNVLALVKCAVVTTHVAVRSKRLKSTLKVVTQYLMAGEKLRNCKQPFVLLERECVGSSVANAEASSNRLVLTCVAMLHICRAVMKLKATMKPLP